MLASLFGIVAGLSFAAAPAPPPVAEVIREAYQESTCWVSVERCGWHVHCRVICAGMTPEQVEAALAPEIPSGLAGFSTSGVIVTFRNYDNLGLTITFCNNGAGADVHVKSVTQWSPRGGS